MAILYAILGIILIIGVWLVLNQITEYQFAHGQNASAPPIVQPTISPTPTPTAPNPNFQYLPQLAYVQSFAPERGVPSSTPLQQIATMPAVQPAPQAAGGFDIASVISMVIAAGSGLLAKMGIDKAKKVEDTSKANSSAIVDSKVVQQELARLLFEWNKDKSDALTDSPVTKLENLKDEVKKATETATDA